MAGVQEVTEQWRAVPEYEGLYEISDLGRVRSLSRTSVRKDGRRYSRFGRMRKMAPDSSGHLQVQLWRDAKPVSHLVHRLVLCVFVGDPPPGLVACHNDGDPTNNRVDNLRWDTQLSNNLDTVRHGRHHQANQTHCKRGHEFTAENTRQQGGSRNCRTCDYARREARNARRRAERQWLMTERGWPAYKKGS
jgi:hypothetical protein